jgi:methyltransferase (TIGR00027 family)
MRKDVAFSRTAEIIAVARAAETNRPEAARLFSDPFAKEFLRPRFRRLVALSRVPGMLGLLNRISDHKIGVKGLMVSFCCRTKSIDDSLIDALRSGYVQIVILGAGFDSRPYRIYNIERATVFEVDLPSTQEFKRARLKKRLKELPSHVVFVPVDFQTQNLADQLQEAGFRQKEKTFFIWEGVTEYLTPDAFDNTLLFIAMSATDSRLVFTYIDRGVIDGAPAFQEAQVLVEHVRSFGEPWNFGLVPAEVGDYLAARGLQLIENLGAKEYQERFLQPIGRADPLPDFVHVALAEVRGETLPPWSS